MWEQIRANRSKSIMLVILMGALLVAVGYLLGMAFFDNGIAGLIIALVLWAILNMVAYFSGDSILLGLSRAKKIKKQDSPRLYNIVEEMKIASGLEHMPEIYIIDDPALNAFATGRDPKRASVAVTSGLLKALNRDELQGVIAHEISHVKNRDVLLMAMCGVLLGTIVILAWYGSRFLFFGSVMGGRRSSSGGGYAQLIVLAVGLVFIILAPIAAQFIYFAVSRKREYLADASGALYTRYPDGLASALEKIGGSTTQLKSANKATAPMFIINPFRNKGMKANDATSTHPPISERVRILRSMSGNLSFAGYESAYEQMHKGRRILPASALAAASTGGMQAVAARPPSVDDTDRIELNREISDLVHRQDHYKMIDCACGAKLKVPPDFRGSAVRCPHCGRVHQV